MRICPRCGRSSDETKFHRSNSTKSGFQGICAECHRQGLLSGIGVKACTKWREEHRDAMRSLMHERYRTKPEAWYRYTHARRTHKEAAAVEEISSRRVYERDGWICQLCGESVDKTLRNRHPMMASLDHIVPVSKGGAHTYDNVQLAHLSCNNAKGARV